MNAQKEFMEVDELPKRPQLKQWAKPFLNVDKDTKTPLSQEEKKAQNASNSYVLYTLKFIKLIY